MGDNVLGSVRPSACPGTEIRFDLPITPDTFIKQNTISIFQFAVQFVLLFCVRGNIGKQQEDSLRKYCAALRRVIDETQLLSNQAEIQLQISEALSLMERDFPLAIQVLRNNFVHLKYSTRDSYHWITHSGMIQVLVSLNPYLLPRELQKTSS